MPNVEETAKMNTLRPNLVIGASLCGIGTSSGVFSVFHNYFLTCPTTLFVALERLRNPGLGLRISLAGSIDCIFGEGTLKTTDLGLTETSEAD
jgi:hypothetical protein